MSKFTSSERRGTIALLILMAIIIVTMAFLRHRGQPPEQLPVPPSIDSVTIDTSANSKAKKSANKTKTSKQKQKKEAKSKNQSDEPHSRSHLDEEIMQQ